ncbi:MAG TPA: HAMP domain-containing protein [Candidatus Blautia excrementipullorum]|nr:HAMP domain-containing protein [Candidatus Blautia excrementipullorum]
MAIRKKIIISNLFMIIVPLLLLFSLGFLWLNTAGERYWKPVEEMYEDRNGVISAQNLIYTYQEELWDTNWEAMENLDDHPDGGEIQQSPEMVRLKKDLTDLGYHFSVMLDGRALYSNLSEGERGLVEKMIGPVSEQAESVTAGNEEVSVIKCSFSEDGEECSIIAVNSGTGNVLGSRSYLQQYVIPYIWIFAVSAVFIIIFVNACCSRWISSLILPPVKEIRKGMQKVRSGNLEGEIRVIRPDELGEVCAEFNEMQRWLKRSREEQAKYETYRKELISGISHDLRTPLTTIKGYVGGLMDGIADTEEKKKSTFRPYRPVLWIWKIWWINFRIIIK